jgi:ATP-binding cassette subfamily F protein uup
VSSGIKPGKMLIETIDLSHTFPDVVICHKFSHKIMAGDRVGLIGPNGIGKTTLLKIMLKELLPDEGRVRHGVRLAPAFLTQMRELNPEQKMKDVLLPMGGNYVHIGGHEPRHIVSYLQDFLFDRERLNARVAALSGGERGRLMLAKLLLEPANLLVLDEPTNDLDIGTLTVLEQALARYEGTVIVVSHDRAFMDRVASRVLAFEGSGEIVSIEGGYSDYLAWKTRQNEQIEAGKPIKRSKPIILTKADRKQTKLSYKEQQRLEALPGEIEFMEAGKAAIEGRFCNPDYFNHDAEAFQQDRQRLHELESLLSEAYTSWEELESKKDSLTG